METDNCMPVLAQHFRINAGQRSVYLISKITLFREMAGMPPRVLPKSVFFSGGRESTFISKVTRTPNWGIRYASRSYFTVTAGLKPFVYISETKPKHSWSSGMLSPFKIASSRASSIRAECFSVTTPRLVFRSKRINLFSPS